MGTTVGVTLHSLHCNRESRGSDGSKPYIWPAMLWINKDTATVGVLAGPLNQNAGTVIQNGMHAGQSAAIPSNVGIMLRPFEDALANHVIILAIALWQRNDTPDNVLQAGFNAYGNSLRDAVQANLLFLNSTDQGTVDTAIQKIKAAVNDSVTSAIQNTLSTIQKAEILAKLLTLDGLIDNSSTVFRNLVAAPFTVTFGGSSADSYEIQGDFQVIPPAVCAAEQQAVNAATIVVNDITAQYALQKQLCRRRRTRSQAFFSKLMSRVRKKLEPR